MKRRYRRERARCRCILQRITCTYYLGPCICAKCQAPVEVYSYAHLLNSTNGWECWILRRGVKKGGSAPAVQPVCLYSFALASDNSCICRNSRASASGLRSSRRCRGCRTSDAQPSTNESDWSSSTKRAKMAMSTGFILSKEATITGMSRTKFILSKEAPITASSRTKWSVYMCLP